jgi:hypothetical protein
MALVALAALVAASSAASVEVDRCAWDQGICSASPGYVLATLGAGAAAPRGPLAERLLRSYALEARCQVLRDAKACGAAEKQGCVWREELVGWPRARRECEGGRKGGAALAGRRREGYRAAVRRAPGHAGHATGPAAPRATSAQGRARPSLPPPQSKQTQRRRRPPGQVRRGRG